MRAGLLTETIVIQRNEKSKDKFGGVVDSWVNVFTAKADVYDVGGNRAYVNDNIENPYDKKFVIWYDRRVKPDMRVIYDNNIYLIKSVNSSRKSQATTIIASIYYE